MKIVQLASLLLLPLMFVICFAGCARTGHCLGGGCGGTCGPQGCGVPVNPQASPQFFPQTNPQFVPRASAGSIPQPNPGFIPSSGGSDVFGGNVSSPAGSNFGLGGSGTR